MAALGSNLQPPAPTQKSGQKFGGIGPGLLVTAAFVGPGTVTTCILAGANFSYDLLWVLILATIATLVFHDMTARLGAGARLGLGQALLNLLPSGRWRMARWLFLGLVFVALGLGNAAFEAGNLAGAAIGWSLLPSDLPGVTAGRSQQVAVLTLLAGGLLLLGGAVLVQRLLLGLVLLMSVAFIGALFLLSPALSDLLAGLMPQLPVQSSITSMALVGTTIVSYNLFLHAALVQRRWANARGVPAARLDSALAIILGGLVSLAILACAATAVVKTGLSVTSAADLVEILSPVYGDEAQWLLGLGLLAAGLTSALTAPLATAYIFSELSQRPTQAVFDWQQRLVAMVVLTVGAGISLLNLNPLSIILLAQFANGLLLPLVAVALLVIMNQRSVLAKYTNGLVSNLFGGLVVLLCLALGFRSLVRVFG